MIVACTAAPYAMASSGLVLLLGYNAGNAGRTANKDNLVNVGLVDLRVTKHLFDGLQSAADRKSVV